MVIMNLKEVDTKNPTYYYFDDITKIEDCDFDNILIDANHIKIFWFNILIQNYCVLASIK